MRAPALGAMPPRSGKRKRRQPQEEKPERAAGAASSSAEPAAGASSSAAAPADVPELPPLPAGKAVPPSWPPWIARTAETLEKGRAALPKGVPVPQGLAPAVPSSQSVEHPFTQRLKKHLLYRYSEAGVRATSFRPERWSVYVLGRPVQVLPLGCAPRTRSASRWRVSARVCTLAGACARPRHAVSCAASTVCCFGVGTTSMCGCVRSRGCAVRTRGALSRVAL